VLHLVSRRRLWVEEGHNVLNFAGVEWRHGRIVVGDWRERGGMEFPMALGAGDRQAGDGCLISTNRAAPPVASSAGWRVSAVTMSKGIAALLALCALGMACCMLAIGWGSSAHPGVLLSSQSLSYSDRGMTWKEKDAVRKSKDLARKAAGKVDNTPSLVDRFMGAWKTGLGRAENEWDNGIAPTLKNRVSFRSSLPAHAMIRPIDFGPVVGFHTHTHTIAHADTFSPVSLIDSTSPITPHWPTHTIAPADNPCSFLSLI
jgi:hypothetical protein